MSTRLSLLVLALMPLTALAQAEILPPRVGVAGPLAPAPPPPPPSPFDAGPAIEPPAPQSSFFVDVELMMAFPTLRNRHNAPGAYTVPTVDLGTTLSPTFEAGYRLDGDCGFFAASYRFLDTDGSGTVTQFGVPFAVRTRATVNVLDIDYGSAPWELAPRWTLGWRVGVRFADVNIDSRAQSGGLTRYARNEYFGSGGHGRLELERRIVFVPGLSVFGRVDGSVLVGDFEQKFVHEAGGVGVALRDRINRTVPAVNVQAGLSYTPPSLPGLKFSAGYAYEEWFKVGSLGLNANGTTGPSDGELSWHGWFVRGQIDF